MTNLKTSLFAGVLIAIAGWGFLANPVLGMFLFCVGLIAVVKYQTRLYTGTAGFLSSWRDLPSLLLILLGNIVGCLAVASVALVSPLPLGEAAIKVISSRLAVGWWGTGLLAIGCGLLMSLAVDFARKNRDFSDWLPLLFAVPAFILPTRSTAASISFRHRTSPGSRSRHTTALSFSAIS